MHTEDEARELWCPHARVSASNEPAQGNHSANRHAGDGVDPSIPYDACCIASQCMAWRWGPDDAALNERMHGRDATPEFGYCGLAGKPEA